MTNLYTFISLLTLRLTMRTRSFFILPTTIKILHTNNVKVSKDQKMKKNQRLTRPSWRKGELIEGSLARFLQTPPSYVKQPRLYKWRYELQFDVNVLTGCKPKIMYSFWLSWNVIFKFMTNWIQNYANRKKHGSEKFFYMKTGPTKFLKFTYISHLIVRIWKPIFN